MAHCTTREAELILDKQFDVLDHGFVRLVDYMGGDSRIVQAARVSYGNGTKTPSEDEALIDYLMRHRHTSPFEQVELTFHCKMPIFCARQWVRHRTASLNEMSGRYSEMPEETYLPALEHVQGQHDTNKQGRGGAIAIKAAEHYLDRVGIHAHNDFIAYRELLDQGIARELARICLPLSTYTEWYWKIDLHNLFHFLDLRLDEHAQFEIRQYAKVMLRAAGCVAPAAVRAFECNVLNAVTLSSRDAERLCSYVEHGHGLDNDSKSQVREFMTKLKKLGVPVPGIDGE
jgi:thymidylate synthase (FAD)